MRLGNLFGSVLILGALAARPTAAEPPAGEAIVHPKDGAVMVYVPAGPFIMGLDRGDSETVARQLGAPEADTLWMWECYPRRTVTLPGYYLDRCETTVGQWKRFVEASGFTSTPARVTLHAGKPDELAFPVGEIRQEDARAYCAWAGKALPSDEQWEKACRGTNGFYWPWGNSPPTPERANLGPHTRNQAYKRVGQYPLGASPYGCLDMIGNQYEWTDGRVTPYPGNPEAARMAVYNSSSNRCVRGGSFYHGHKSGYASKRMGFENDSTYFHIGFRAVWIPPPGWWESAAYRTARDAVPAALKESQAAGSAP